MLHGNSLPRGNEFLLNSDWGCMHARAEITLMRRRWAVICHEYFETENRNAMLRRVFWVKQGFFLKFPSATNFSFQSFYNSNGVTLVSLETGEELEISKPSLGKSICTLLSKISLLFSLRSRSRVGADKLQATAFAKYPLVSYPRLRNYFKDLPRRIAGRNSCKNKILGSRLRKNEARWKRIPDLD